MVDPIMSMGYGPGSNAGSVMRWGYIGIGEIIRRAVQQLGHARREVQVVIRKFSEDYEIIGNTLVPFDLSIGLKANTLRVYGKILEIASNIMTSFGMSSEIKGNVSRTFDSVGYIYSDVVVPLKETTFIKANTLVEFFKTYIMQGKKDMTAFLLDIVLDDEEDTGK